MRDASNQNKTKQYTTQQIKTNTSEARFFFRRTLAYTYTYLHSLEFRFIALVVVAVVAFLEADEARHAAVLSCGWVSGMEVKGGVYACSHRRIEIKTHAFVHTHVEYSVIPRHFRGLTAVDDTSTPTPPLPSNTQVSTGVIII